MTRKLEREIKKLIRNHGLKLTVEQFCNKSNLWHYISEDTSVSEDFIRHFANKVNWPSICKNQVLSCDFMREFAGKIDFSIISNNQVLDEDFIAEFAGCLDWDLMSSHQRLSENTIRKFKDYVSWGSISRSQNLSCAFIKEFRDRVSWYNICMYQRLPESFMNDLLSEKKLCPLSGDNTISVSLLINLITANQPLSLNFMRKHKRSLNWFNISQYQILSKTAKKEFRSLIRRGQQNTFAKVKSLKQKRIEMADYAKKHNLEFDGEYLYAYRKHDKFGRGVWNKTLCYEVGKYYKDWHCDTGSDNIDSFGLGIWPKRSEVNTLVKVAVKDWGCAVSDICGNSSFGKGRVFGFTVVKLLEDKK